MSAEHAAPSSKGKGKSKSKKKPTPAPAEEVDNTPTFSSLYSIDAFNVGNVRPTLSPSSLGALD